ncbi:hypothetical protein [Frigoriglobus tundricola]|uniref:hypothetical protein n=1 Tax=Frigoriglobus tundricola TaxID=2774151 RepID=UPI00148EE1A0|nr:hypothetical protein [Frigoriglobus tundricola]
MTDADAEKRTKVVGWMANDEATRAALAKKLGLPADVRVLHARFSADKQFVELVLEAGDARHVKPAPATGSVQASSGIATMYTSTDVFGRVVSHGEGAHEIDLYLGARDTTEAKPARAASGRKAALNPLTAVTDWKIVANSHVVGPDPIGLAVLGAAPRIVGTNELTFSMEASVDSDAEFLKRALAEVRGNAPTALETKYFTEDPDPKKRERLLDTLLKDPAVQKKLGAAWKAKMLEPRVVTLHQIKEPTADRLIVWVQPGGAKPPVPSPQAVKPSPPVPNRAAVEPDKYEKLVVTLIAANESDEAMMDAVTLATLSRLPTDSEKKRVVASTAATSDRKAAWLAVARSLEGAKVKPAPIGVMVVTEPPAPKPAPAKP